LGFVIEPGSQETITSVPSGKVTTFLKDDDATLQPDLYRHMIISAGARTRKSKLPAPPVRAGPSFAASGEDVIHDPHWSIGDQRAIDGIIVNVQEHQESNGAHSSG